MIKYRLTCQKAHEFEGWFGSSKAFDQQVKKKLVTCPVCGSFKVEKALMAPSVVTSENKTRRKRQAAKEAGAAPAEATETASPRVMASPEQREMLREMRKLRDAILAKSEYVGPRFADEARRIHNEEKDQPRGIYGEASPTEVKSLVEDGIEVYPVPVLPDDHN